MDLTTLEAMVTAYRVTPENKQLFLIILKGFKELEDFEKGNEFLASCRPIPTMETEEEQRQIASYYLNAGLLEKALAHCIEHSPHLDMIRAHALFGLGRHEDAKEAYVRAVKANPALEDRELEARLTPFVGSRILNHDGKESKLRVISNDNTDHLEIQRAFIPEMEKVDFSHVGGLDDVKKEIHKKIILPFQKPSLFQRFKKRSGGGILLYGPPGCGKTLLARATAGEVHADFFNISISDILDMYMGESERKLHAIFELARAKAPSVLFFDELEALAGKRQYSRDASAAKVVSQFLTEMDGFAQDNKNVLILGATNVPWAIDPAFRRPGRFDRVLFVPPPDKPARASILKIHLEARPHETGIPVDLIAKKTGGFSGADLLNLVETASDLAIEASIEKESEVPLNTEMLMEAVKQVKPTTLEWLTTARNYARYANEGGQYDDVLAFLQKYGRT